MIENIVSDSKQVKGDFLLLLLGEIEANGDNIKKLAKNLNWSKQRLNYHLNHKLKKLGIVQKTQSYPFAIYSLTPFGQRVKKILGQSDSVKPLWRCHALIVGFEIRNYGNFSFKNRKISPMRNWNYCEETIKDSIGVWKIHVQSTGLLKIYCPEKYDENPDLAFGILERIASNLAEKYAETYNMKLGLLKLIREGHKELVNSETLAKLFGKITKIANVWVDASTGTQWLEETQSTNSIEKLLKVPEGISRLENHLIKQTQIMDQFSLQMKLHLEVMNDMRETLRAIRDSFQK